MRYSYLLGISYNKSQYNPTAYRGVSLTRDNIQLMYEINKVTIPEFNKFIFVLNDNRLEMSPFVDDFLFYDTCNIYLMEEESKNEYINVDFYMKTSSTCSIGMASENNIENDIIHSNGIIYSNYKSVTDAGTKDILSLDVTEYIYNNFPNVKSFAGFRLDKTDKIAYFNSSGSLLSFDDINDNPELRMIHPLYSINNFEYFLMTILFRKRVKYEQISLLDEIFDKEYKDYLCKDIVTYHSFRNMTFDELVKSFTYTVYSFASGSDRGFNRKFFYVDIHKISDDIDVITIKPEKNMPFSYKDINGYKFNKNNIDGNLSDEDYKKNNLHKMVNLLEHPEESKENIDQKLKSRLKCNILVNSKTSDDYEYVLKFNNFSKSSLKNIFKDKKINRGVLEDTEYFIGSLFNVGYKREDLFKSLNSNKVSNYYIISKNTKTTNGNLYENLFNKIDKEKINDEYIDYIDKILDPKTIVNTPVSRPIKTPYNKSLSRVLLNYRPYNYSKISFLNILNTYSTPLIKALYIDKNISDEEINKLLNITDFPFMFLLASFLLYSKYKFKSNNNIDIFNEFGIKLNKFVKKSNSTYFENIIKISYINFIFEDIFSSGMKSNYPEAIKNNSRLLQDKINRRDNKVVYNNNTYNILKDKIPLKDIIHEMLSFVKHKLESKNMYEEFINNFTSAVVTKYDFIYNNVHIPPYRPVTEIIKNYIIKNLLPYDEYKKYAMTQLEVLNNLLKHNYSSTLFLLSYLFYIFNEKEIDTLYKDLNYDFVMNIFMNIDFREKMSNEECNSGTLSNTNTYELLFNIPDVYKGHGAIHSEHLKIIKQKNCQLRSALLSRL